MNKMSLKKQFYKVFILLLSFNLISCENVGHCNNTNPIFDKFNPDSKEYKNELIQKLKTLETENISYFITGCGHDKEQDVEYLAIRIEGEDLCAYANIKVYKKDLQISPIFETEAFGYRGSEIEGLKLEIIQDSIKPEFIYRGMERIID